MIRHCVFFKFRADVPQVERDGIYTQLAALVDAIDGLIAVKFGPNVSPEGLGRGFDDGFIMDLRDVAARDAYLIDPAHKAAGARLVGALQDGLNGLIVFDLKI